MRRWIEVRMLTRNIATVLAAALVAGVVGACGSSSSTTNGGANSAGSSGSSPASTPISGIGLTQPTAPSGTRTSGGTVYFTEVPEQMPNYIFPMYSPQVCGTQNINQLMDMMYRPLYWYGNNYRPTIDYDYSIGKPPRFSDQNKTVTIKLNSWKWADGESVTSRDLMFWMNMMKADPATEWCGYVPGYFPDNVTSYSAPNPSTFVLHFNKSYNPTWVTYNELSQLTPLPLAWDRTSLAQPAPTSDSGHLPDVTKAGAGAVYQFLNAQAKDLGTWATSPLWKVVDGPFRLQNFTSSSEVTLVPNPKYSGSPKPSISKLVLLPFTSEAALYNEVRSSGTGAITVADLPQQYAPQVPTLTGEGYDYNKAASYSVNYFPFNLHNPQVGPIFSQLYFRQAFQHLIDQPGWISAFLSHTANPTYGPIPPSPPSPLAGAVASTNPYPFSVSAAKALLTSHGWKVVPGGSTTCQNPTLCGPGIKKGEGISFNIDYASGIVALEDEMNDLTAQAKKVGIDINLTTHPFATVIGTAIACKPTQPTCKWQAENWGAGWIYGPSYLPTGEQLFAPGAVANYGSYNNPTTAKLIRAVPVAAHATQALDAYAANVEHMLPVVFGPTSIGTYSGDAGVLVDKHLGGYAANALGLMNPEDWYFTK
jgi:peptide/nickel transport system substrate-binding protein